jgi:hypothetical protein
MSNFFWTDSRLEPKRGYRFLVTVGEMPNAATYYVKSVTKPGIKISAKEHMYLGHRFHYPGLVTWDPNPIVIKMVDPVSPDASQHLSAIIQASGYVVPGNPGQVTTMSKNASVNALGTVVIKQINESHGVQGLNGGEAVETWVLHNAFVEGVKFGDLDYSKEELTEIELSVRYDWATLETRNGVQNPRTIAQLGNAIGDIDPNVRFK